MTVYAIVNNILSESNGSNVCRPIWTVISQSGILQGGNPYFVPDFASRFEARIALAVRIGRLGKGIAHRFAHRYVEAAAPSIVFVASDLLHDLRRDGFPWSTAISYDKCLAIGKFCPCSLEQCYHSLITLALESSDSTIETTWNGELIQPRIEDTIAALSRDNTLKTGDIILFGIDGKGPEIVPDKRALLSLNGSESLKFNIR